VLGASGFLGRHVASRLCQRGADTILAGRNARALANLADSLGRDPTLELFDAAQPGSASDLLARLRPHVVFNLIGYGVDRAEREETLARRLNAELVSELCDAAGSCCERWDGQAIVHVGSALEYGKHAGGLAEDVRPDPDTQYGRTKLEGTAELLRRTRERGIAAVVARLFTVYGPGEHAGRLLPALLAASRSGEELALTSGEQKRDFTYAEDVAEGLERLALARMEEPAICHLATGKLHSVREFAEIAARFLRMPSTQLRFGLLPTRPEEMFHGEVSIERLIEWTGWKPRTSIAEGISRTLAAERSG
jgi:nucleoside-diphosphate-sugar epimerase